jgi:hypothetical protein
MACRAEVIILRITSSWQLCNKLVLTRASIVVVGAIYITWRIDIHCCGETKLPFNSTGLGRWPSHRVCRWGGEEYRTPLKTEVLNATAEEVFAMWNLSKGLRYSVFIVQKLLPNVLHIFIQ